MVGEYSSIFLHHSLLTLSYLRNFTPQALHALLVWGYRLSNARILRPAVDPSTLPRRRFLEPATSEVPRVGHFGGCSAHMRRRFIPSAASPETSFVIGRLEGSLLLRPQISAGVPVSAYAQHSKSHVNVSLSQGPPHASARRFLGWRIALDATRSEVPRVRDNLRRYHGEGCGHPPTSE